MNINHEAQARERVGLYRVEPPVAARLRNEELAAHRKMEQHLSRSLHESSMEVTRLTEENRVLRARAESASWARQAMVADVDLLTKRLEEANAAPRQREDTVGEMRRLRLFAGKVLAASDEGGDVYYEDIVEFATLCELLEAKDVTAACGEHCACAGVGDWPQVCHRRTEEGRRCAQAAGVPA